MQQLCSTNEGQKVVLSHPATNEGPEQTIFDVSTSKGSQATHAGKPVASAGSPPYQRRIAVSAMR